MPSNRVLQLPDVLITTLSLLCHAFYPLHIPLPAVLNGNLAYQSIDSLSDGAELA